MCRPEEEWKPAEIWSGKLSKMVKICEMDDLTLFEMCNSHKEDPEKMALLTQEMTIRLFKLALFGFGFGDCP